MATLLETVFRLDGTPRQVEVEVLRRLESGGLRLSGSFRNQEQRILGHRPDHPAGPQPIAPEACRWSRPPQPASRPPASQRAVHSARWRP